MNSQQKIGEEFVKLLAAKALHLFTLDRERATLARRASEGAISS